MGLVWFCSTDGFGSVSWMGLVLFHGWGLVLFHGWGLVLFHRWALAKCNEDREFFVCVCVCVVRVK